MAFDYAEYKEEEKIYLAENIHIYKHSNPHPKELNVGDCVKRAIVLATGMDYRELKIDINRHKREMQKRKRKHPIESFNDNRNWIPYMEKTFDVTKLTEYRNMKIGDFAKLNLPGRYIATCRHHIVAIIDGMVMDSWNSSFKAIGKIWRIN